MGCYQHQFSLCSIYNHAISLDMQGHGDYLIRPREIAMPPNKSNDIINSFFTLPHTCSAVRFLDIYLLSLPYHNKETKIPYSLFLKSFYTTGETASSLYSAILNGVVGVHIDKRAFSRDQRYLILIGQYVLERYLSAATMDKRVAIGTRSANQNPESRRICRGVPIEARPY